jgi:hypothetical protein
MPDITDLIRAEHARLCRLFDALDDTARLAEASGTTGRTPRWAPQATWARIAGLLELHAEAEYEICYFAVFGPGTSQTSNLRQAVSCLNEIHNAVAEAQLQEPGSRSWWRAVAAARRSSLCHITQLEAGPLADFRRRSTPQLREDLGQQWEAFVAAYRRDLTADLRPASSRPGLRMWQQFW